MIYDLSNINVLVADDYEFIQTLMTGLLDAFGVENILSCSNGYEARNILTTSLKTRPIDILLTDWRMPGGPGSDSIRWVRYQKNESIRFMPIILITALATKETISFARDYGVNEILLKPISGERLASRILAVIDHPKDYLKTPNFFGPDRGRKEKDSEEEDQRKTLPEDIIYHKEEL